MSSRDSWISFLYDTETGRRPDGLSCHTMRLPRDELGKQFEKTLARLQEYSDIHCYLDNDLAGQRTTETIAGMYGGRVSDESCHYAEYKDLNDYLRGKKR